MTQQPLKGWQGNILVITSDPALVTIEIHFLRKKSPGIYYSNERR